MSKNQSSPATLLDAPVEKLVETPATSTALAVQEPVGIVAMFERFATDPNASVEKIERLMALYERDQARRAKEAFSVAMADAQQEMRPVAADAQNPQTKSRYASYAQLDRALRPIYTKHGFAPSFNTADSPLPEHVRVVCNLNHRGGHIEPYHLDMPADGKGAKGGDVMTKTHATGSALSYGMRYLLKMIFNIAVGEDDDDGNAAGQRPKPEVRAPVGFEDWWLDMMAVAQEGTKKLEDAWTNSKKEFKRHVMATNKNGWMELKRQAGAVRS